METDTPETRALKTIRTMLTDSGIEGEFEGVQSPLEETRMFMFGPVLVVFSEKTRVTDREFSKLLEYAEANDMKGGMIIVSPSAPSELVVSSLTKYIANPENPLVQLFEIRHLGFDIAKHRQVPKHRILVKEDLDAFMKEYSFKVEQLPKLWCQDPMAKRIRARPGDIVEVKGLSMTSGEYRHARLCVERV